MAGHDHRHHESTDHHHDDDDDRDRHGQHGAGLNRMAASATLHCLTGCAVGEILGLIIGTAAGLSNGAVTAIAIGLAFVFGYSLSTLPLVKAGLSLGGALSIVLVADTLSIATMEAVDNAVMLLIPGAMNAGLVNVVFWIGMAIALSVAYLAAYPVNRFLLRRGRGHALTHHYHHQGPPASGPRRLIPDLSTGTLAAVIASFMLGGLVVSIADELTSDESPHHDTSETGHARIGTAQPSPGGSATTTAFPR